MERKRSRQNKVQQFGAAPEGHGARAVCKNRANRRAVKLLLGAWCLLALIRLAPATQAQTISGFVRTQAGRKGITPTVGVVYIDPSDLYSFPDPDVSFGLSGNYSSCYEVVWDITIKYTDQDGYQTSYYGDAILPATSLWYNVLPYAQGEGGTVTVTASLYSPAGTYLSSPPAFVFQIEGKKQSQAQTDEAKPGGFTNYNDGISYWFFGSMLSVESGKTDDQFAENNNCNTHGCNHLNDPLWGYPDGIGVMQDDRTQNSFPDSVYWNYEENEGEAGTILDNEANGSCPGGSCAYPFWDSQMQQMCKWTHGIWQKGASDGQSTCSKVQQPNTGAPPTGPTYKPGSEDYYTPQPLPTFCTFHFRLSDNEPSDWRDAELIKAYNGASPYYIFWHPDYLQPTLYQYWVFNNYSGTKDNDYVSNVCNATDY